MYSTMQRLLRLYTILSNKQLQLIIAQHTRNQAYQPLYRTMQRLLRLYTILSNKQLQSIIA